MVQMHRCLLIVFISEKKKIPKVIRRSSEKGKRKFWSSNLRDTLVEMLLFGVLSVNNSSPQYHDFLGVSPDRICLWIWKRIFCWNNVDDYQQSEKSYSFKQSVTLKQIKSRATAPWVDKRKHLFWSKMIFYAMAWMNKIQVFFP